MSYSNPGIFIDAKIGNSRLIHDASGYIIHFNFEDGMSRDVFNSNLPYFTQNEKDSLWRELTQQPPNAFKRKSLKRKSPKRKSLKSKSLKRKSHKRKSNANR